MTAERITIDPLFARASTHPELAGARLELVVGRRGGITGFKGVGKHAGKVFSPRVIGRVLTAPHIASSTKAFTSVLTPSAYREAVARYLIEHPGTSVSRARLAVYEAEAYMYKARTKQGLASQTLDKRTAALRILGSLKDNEYSAGFYPVKFNNPEVRTDMGVI